jgi:hypothetical protein
MIFRKVRGSCDDDALAFRVDLAWVLSSSKVLFSRQVSHTPVLTLGDPFLIAVEVLRTIRCGDPDERKSEVARGGFNLLLNG